MSKEFKRYLPIWMILLIVTNIVVWVIDLDRSNGFYVSYIIVNIALLIQLGISHYALSKKRALCAPIMAKSIVVVIVLVLLNIYILYSAYIDPVLGVLFPELPLFGFLLKKVDIPKAIMVADVVLLAINYIVVILLGQHGDRMETRDQHAIEKTAVMRKLTSKAKMLAETRKDPQLQKIYEGLKYSKNVSTEEGYACAAKIDELLSDIENENRNTIIRDEEYKIINDLIARLSNL
jgi:hypothetical protein